MKRTTLLLFAILVLAVFFGFQDQQGLKFYYAFNEKITLTEVEAKLVIRFSESSTKESSEAILSRDYAEVHQEWQDDRTVIISANSRPGRDKILKDQQSSLQVVSIQPLYKISTGLEMAITDEFLVKFKGNSISDFQKEIQAKYNTSVVRVTDTYTLLKVPKGVDVLEVANKFISPQSLPFRGPCVPLIHNFN